MLIANPIYDVVFKYLMDDNKVAKLLISAIIGQEIEVLEVRPTENFVTLEYKSLTVYRLDFCAKIKTPEGSKLVLIEIQKAKYSADIMRFRKYLGSQYSDSKNAYTVKDAKKEYIKALPIISIYFLGHKLEHTQAPVIRVQRNYVDVATGEELLKKEEFIESLTHDSYIIQIPFLKEKRRNELEMILSVFDQQNQTYDSRYFLNVNEEDLPEKYKIVVRRLQQAMAEAEMKKKMEMEDEIIEELCLLERAIQENERIIQESEKIIQENEKIIQENEKIIEKNIKKIEESEKTIRENQNTILEKEKTLEEKDKSLEEKDNEIKMLKDKLKNYLKI
jgi:hypothetical protein